MKPFVNINVIIVISLFIFSCEGEEGSIGPNGLNSLINISVEAPGENCETGGIKVDVGLDNNSDGILDESEIQGTSFICNGIDGSSSLTSVTSEESGDNCPNGGIRVESGVDLNENGTLDQTEITATAFICNGIDGNNSLTKVTMEADGENCENGGLKIESGIDSNSNNILDNSEIDATAYVCNGIDGSSGLIKTTNEAEGENCENGGVKFESGLDLNENGILDESEISTTSFVCNGIDGDNSLTKISTESSGTNCESGGLKIEIGLDENSNGVLDDDEIDNTSFVCHGNDGIDGNNGFIKTTNESAGDNCENGGLKIDSGIDTNNNGVLDSDEIVSTAYVCNGVDGNDGSDGSNSITKVLTEESGNICEAGGIKVQSGVDSNNDGELDDTEITFTEYVCNGDYDKLVRIPVGPVNFGNSSNDWRYSQYETWLLYNFNKLNYTGVDSITFVPSLNAYSSSNACEAQLYNTTDSTAIESSLISTTVQSYHYYESGDIQNDLPEGNKLFGIRIRRGTTGLNCFIFVYRD